ncbi:MAG TPA: hypothetical protein V6C72_03930, partial [Chroococcales cyanobacterium]
MYSIHPLFVTLTPLAAALLTALPQRYVSGRNYKIGFWLLAAGFAGSLAILWQATQTVEPMRVLLFA